MDISIVIERLHQARALIEDKKHWCQNFLAVDFYGAAAPPSGLKAEAWCAEGALIKSFPLDPELDSYANRVVAQRALVQASLELFGDGFAKRYLAETAKNPETPKSVIAFINDYYGHMAVLQSYDRAIYNLENQLRS